MYHYFILAVVIFLAFPLALTVHAHLQIPSMYYYIDQSDDVIISAGGSNTRDETIDQPEKHLCQSTNISSME